jgi:hypothetical protein
MIYKNENGYPTDGFSHDTMDSAVRISILSFMAKQPLLNSYYNPDTKLVVRCPEQAPANNPLNCSRDQMLMLIAAFNFNKSQGICKGILWATIKRFGFAQNIERDVPGSTKHPYPHVFLNDHNIIERREFDYADPFLPHHLGALIIAARAYILYPFLIFSWLFLLLEILTQPKALDKEQNQLIAMCTVYGKTAMRLYVKHNEYWMSQNRFYWGQRNEDEYADIIEMIVHSYL